MRSQANLTFSLRRIYFVHDDVQLRRQPTSDAGHSRAANSGRSRPSQRWCAAPREHPHAHAGASVPAAAPAVGRLTTMPLQPTRQCDGSGKARLFRRLGIAAEPAAAVGSSSCLGGGPIARRESSPPAAIGCAEQLPGRLIRVQPGEHRLRQVDMVSSPAKQSSGRGQFRVRKPGLRRRRGS